MKRDSVTASDQEWIFINNEFLRAEDAKVSVFDHGFLYGDGIFESMVVFNSRIFRLDDHVDRLFASAQAIALRIPLPKEKMKEAILSTVRKNQLKDTYVRVVVTRGQGYPVLDPRIPERPTLVVLTYKQELPPVVAKTYHSREAGIRAVVVSTRKTPSVSLDSRIKSLNYLNNIMARLEATNAGAHEAILLDCNNFVAEAPGANVCVVKKKTIHSPELNNQLDGITLRVVLNLAKKKGYLTERTNMTRYDLYTADEVFLTSTTPGITPVSEIDGRQIGTQRPGPVTKELAAGLRELISTECPP
jgi:branched-chain amino acid aminotransferase